MTKNNGISAEFPFNSIDAIVRANKSAGQYFFSPGAMRGFKSKTHDTVHGNRFFVTSEKQDDCPRLYSVRHALPSGEIETVSDFQQFTTLKAADNAAKALTADDARVWTNVNREGIPWRMSARVIDGYVVVTAVPSVHTDIMSQIPQPSNAQYRRVARLACSDEMKMVDKGSKYGHPRIYRIIES